MDDLWDFKLYRKNLMFLSIAIILIGLFSKNLDSINLGIIHFSSLEFFSLWPIITLLIWLSYVLIRYLQQRINYEWKPREAVLVLKNLEKIWIDNINYIKEAYRPEGGRWETIKFDSKYDSPAWKIEKIFISFSRECIHINAQNHDFIFNRIITNPELTCDYWFDWFLNRASFTSEHYAFEIHFNNRIYQRIISKISYWIEEKYYIDYFFPVFVWCTAYIYILYELLICVLWKL